MLPDCNVRIPILAHRFSPSWQVVFFGNPEDAIKALQAEGLNYFFFSATLAMQAFVRDAVVLTGNNWQISGDPMD